MIETVLHLVDYRGRDAHAARRRHCFQPRGHVDALANQVVALDENITEVAQQPLAGRKQVSILRRSKTLGLGQQRPAIAIRVAYSAA